MNYYNEFDPKAAAWLRELIRAKQIPDGFVDERSIAEVNPPDLAHYEQCHFFAGIGGWSRALHLARWPADRPIWTGSCPCQPFSAAGKHGGTADTRHLWPEFFHLIAKCGPSIVFGEQVASKAGLGWFDGVCSDLEGANYAVGAADLCAAGFGAPHIRQRLYWVADSDGRQCDGFSDGKRCIGDWPKARRFESDRQLKSSGKFGGLEYPQSVRWIERRPQSGQRSSIGGCVVSSLADPVGQGLEVGNVEPTRQECSSIKRNRPNFWDDFDLIPCADGKTRRIESGSFPLAHGVPGRVGLLRGYGNAIVPEQAAIFVEESVKALGL